MRLLIFMTAAALSATACSRGVADAAAPGASTAAAIADSREAPTSKATREVTIPAGTVLPVALDTSVGSDTSHAEEAVHAHLTRDIKLDGVTVVEGVTVVPTGSRISGVVTDATRSGRVKGRAHVAMRFETLAPSGDAERYTIHTSAIGRTAEATKGKDAIEIGAPAAGGALIGGLLGGKKGALIGGAVGAGGGTAVVLSTRGKEVSMPRGAALSLKLTEPVTVRVKA